jgi:hypothetical protein
LKGKYPPSLSVEVFIKMKNDKNIGNEGGIWDDKED